MLFPRLGLSHHSFSPVVLHHKCSTAVLSVADPDTQSPKLPLLMFIQTQSQVVNLQWAFPVLLIEDDGHEPFERCRNFHANRSSDDVQPTVCVIATYTCLRLYGIPVLSISYSLGGELIAR